MFPGFDEQVLSLPEEHEGEADVAQAQDRHPAGTRQKHDGVCEPVQVVEDDHFDRVQQTVPVRRKTPL